MVGLVILSVEMKGWTFTRWTFILPVLTGKKIARVIWQDWI